MKGSTWERSQALESRSSRFDNLCPLGQLISLSWASGSLAEIYRWGIKNWHMPWKRHNLLQKYKEGPWILDEQAKLLQFLWGLKRLSKMRFSWKAHLSTHGREAKPDLSGNNWHSPSVIRQVFERDPRFSHHRIV